MKPERGGVGRERRGEGIGYSFPDVIQSPKYIQFKVESSPQTFFIFQSRDYCTFPCRHFLGTTSHRSHLSMKLRTYSRRCSRTCPLGRHSQGKQFNGNRPDYLRFLSLGAELKIKRRRRPTSHEFSSRRKRQARVFFLFNHKYTQITRIYFFHLMCCT